MARLRSRSVSFSFVLLLVVHYRCRCDELCIWCTGYYYTVAVSLLLSLDVVSSSACLARVIKPMGNWLCDVRW